MAKYCVFYSFIFFHTILVCQQQCHLSTLPTLTILAEEWIATIVQNCVLAHTNS